MSNSQQQQRGFAKRRHNWNRDHKNHDRRQREYGRDLAKEREIEAMLQAQRERSGHRNDEQAAAPGASTSAAGSSSSSSSSVDASAPHIPGFVYDPSKKRYFKDLSPAAAPTLHARGRQKNFKLKRLASQHATVSPSSTHVHAASCPPPRYSSNSGSDLLRCLMQRQTGADACMLAAQSSRGHRGGIAHFAASIQCSHMQCRDVITGRLVGRDAAGAAATGGDLDAGGVSDVVCFGGVADFHPVAGLVFSGGDQMSVCRMRGWAGGEGHDSTVELLYRVTEGGGGGGGASTSVSGNTDADALRRGRIEHLRWSGHVGVGVGSPPPLLALGRGTTVDVIRFSGLIPPLPRPRRAGAGDGAGDGDWDSDGDATAEEVTDRTWDRRERRRRPGMVDRKSLDFGKITDLIWCVEWAGGSRQDGGGESHLLVGCDSGVAAASALDSDGGGFEVGDGSSAMGGQRRGMGGGGGSRRGRLLMGTPSPVVSVCPRRQSRGGDADCALTELFVGMRNGGLQLADLRCPQAGSGRRGGGGGGGGGTAGHHQSYGDLTGGGAGRLVLPSLPVCIDHIWSLSNGVHLLAQDRVASAVLLFDVRFPSQHVATVVDHAHTAHRTGLGCRDRCLRQRKFWVAEDESVVVVSAPSAVCGQASDAVAAFALNGQHDKLCSVDLDDRSAALPTVGPASSCSSFYGAAPQMQQSAQILRNWCGDLSSIDDQYNCVAEFAGMLNLPAKEATGRKKSHDLIAQHVKFAFRVVKTRSRMGLLYGCYGCQQSASGNDLLFSVGESPSVPV